MKLNEILKKYNLVAQKYETIGNVKKITTNKGIFVYKDGKIKKDIFEYLLSRSFDYYPRFISSFSDNYKIMEYEEDYNIPKEQKMLDLVNLVSLLHSKTTHYKKVSQKDKDQLYDDLENNINYLFSYYTDLITIIETKVYMSPGEYILALNIDKIFASIEKCKEYLQKLKKETDSLEKMRYTLNHGNLSLDHFITNNNQYLISFEKAKIDLPVFDIYKLYKKHSSEINFTDIIKEYEKNYPLNNSEKILFKLLITMPETPNFTNNNYQNTLTVNKIIDSIIKTEKFTKTI